VLYQCAGEDYPLLLSSGQIAAFLGDEGIKAALKTNEIEGICEFETLEQPTV
jgi:hypothetical protein